MASPYRKIEPHPFLIANSLRTGSYVSLQSALAYYGLIPEHVPVVTSVTTARPERLDTPVGTYSFRHVKKSCFFSYVQVAISQNQHAFIATPEKALLDLMYLTPGGEHDLYLRELRLQNLEIIDIAALATGAERFESAKIRKGLKNVKKIIEEEKYEDL